MPFELQIALRYLLGRRRQAFISIISVVSTLGVTVGVLALIVAMAMMTGLQSELRDRILGSTAHAFVFKTTGIQDYHAEIAALRKIPRIVGAAPALIGRAMASSAGADAFISFKGIEPELEGNHANPSRVLRCGDVVQFQSHVVLLLKSPRQASNRRSFPELTISRSCSTSRSGAA